MWFHSKGINDINLPTCFVYILLRVGAPPPKLSLNTSFTGTYIKLFHIFITIMYPMFIVYTQFRAMQK